MSSAQREQELGDVSKRRSQIALADIGLNTLLGWWWADPVAALGMGLFIAKEGREA